jgi:hypothetical protein
MKKCSKCKKDVSYSLFHRGSNGGYSSYCKPCAAQYNKEKIKRKKKKMYKDEISRQCRSCEIIKLNKDMSVGYKCKSCNAHQSFIRGIEKKYGITFEQYEKMHDSQGNACCICNKKDKLSVDHDHSCCSGPTSCGRCIRGLICFKCNVALGMVNDDKRLLQNMILYLQKL